MELTSFIPIAYDPIYRLPLPENHRFPMEKYELLPQQLLLEGTCEPSDFFTPTKVALENVLRIHNKEYVTRLINLNLTHKRDSKNWFSSYKGIGRKRTYDSRGDYYGV